MWYNIIKFMKLILIFILSINKQIIDVELVKFELDSFK